MNENMKCYYEFVKSLEPVYMRTLDNDEQNKNLFKDFMEKIRSYFKHLDIKFDTTVRKALIRRLEEQFRNFYYEDVFINTLQFVKRFGRVLRKEKFIGLRD